MAFTTYPLNNTDYSAEDAELFHCTRSSGIYAGEDFQPTVTGSDRSITIGPGLGWIRNSKFSGKVVAQKEPVTLDLGLSDATYPRIDAVAIRFSAVDNRTALVVKQGAAASNPVAPALEQAEAVYELHLCHVRRPAGSAVVSVADVTDLRMSPQYCGLMADSVTSVDTKKIDAQISALVRRLDSAIAGTQRGAGFMCKTLLWENENPDSEFSSQSLPVACENYDGIEIVCLEKAYLTATWSSGVIPYSPGAMVRAETIVLGDYVGKILREYVLRSGDIYVGTGRFEGLEVASERNNEMIPVKVYGYTGTIDPDGDTPPAGQTSNLEDMIFDLDVEMSTSGMLKFTNNEQIQKVYDNNMSIYVVYYAEVSGVRHIYRCVCPAIKETLAIGTASGGAIVSAGGCYNNHNTNQRFDITVFFDSDKFAADETLEVTDGSYMGILTGVTVARVYASIF